MDRYLLPYNAAWHQCVNEGVYPPPFIDDLKALAKEEGLWNMFLPDLKANEPGTGLSHLDYAPLAETMGRLPCPNPMWLLLTLPTCKPRCVLMARTGF